MEISDQDIQFRIEIVGEISYLFTSTDLNFSVSFLILDHDSQEAKEVFMEKGKNFAITNYLNYQQTIQTLQEKGISCKNSDRTEKGTTEESCIDLAE